MCKNIKRAFLAPTDPAVQALIKAGWRVAAENDNHPEFWHGENVMVRAADRGAMQEKLFYSLADKF